MMDENNKQFVMMIPLFFFCVVVGIVVGVVIAHRMMWDELSDAGIERLKRHTTVVDGVQTTNWVEVVWKKNGGAS